MVQALVLIVIVVAVAFWWRRARMLRQQSQVKRAPERPNPATYHCVEVRYQAGACDAVKQLGEKRFLSAEAPPLPVPGCDAPKCSCRYVHHDDRRQEDRRHPLGSVPPSLVASERRSKATDRRKSSKRPFKPRIGR
jgi:hypothetical protein